VFSHIYQSNLSPAKVTGFSAGAGRNELAVDNFLTVFFFNDFNAQLPKSLESLVFIYFREGLALIECPASTRLKSALQALIRVSSTLSIRDTQTMRCRAFYAWVF
jgi:hypothetical protein